MTTTLQNAIDRSSSHTERVDVDYAGTVSELLTDLHEIYDGDIDEARENDGDIDVWGCKDGSETMEWRLCVTLTS